VAVRDSAGPAFLSGGGELGALIRAHDWSASPLGRPETWPEALRVALGLCLNSSFPSAVYWGAELTILYNDAWAANAAGKHPWSLGRPAREARGDIWEVIKPQFANVMATGKGISTVEQMLPMERDGQIHETWWNYSVMPIRTAEGVVSGIFTQGHETTGQVLARRDGEARAERLRQAAEATGRSEERLQLALAAAQNIGTWDWDVATNRVIIDARTCEHFGLDPARGAAGVSSREFSSRIHAEDRHRFLDALASVGVAGGVISAEFRVPRADGSIRWIFGRGNVSVSPDGAPLRNVGVTLDITERKEAEEAARSGALRRAFVDELADRLRDVATPDEAIAIACEKLGRRLGVERCGYSEVDPANAAVHVLSDWTDGMPSMKGPVDFGAFGPGLTRELIAGRTVRIDDALGDEIARESTTAYASAGGLRAALTVPLIKQGRLTGAFFAHATRSRRWTGDDVVLVEEVAQRTWAAVERAKADVALRESEERFRLVAESAPVKLWMSNTEGQCVYLNKAQREFWGIAHEDVLTFSWGATIHPDDATSLFESLELAMATRTSFGGEARYRRWDGEWRILRTNAQPRIGTRGEFLGMIGVNVDVTDRRIAELNLRAETKRLETLNRTGAMIAAEFNLDRIVQTIVDAGVELTGAQFGAFFYNVVKNDGESFMLYTLSGAPDAAFANFPMPRATAVFQPTFHGEGIIRSGDILADPRYGRNAPYHGMPDGHPPVRSYMAVPVVARSGEVIGGLFFGHGDAGVFKPDHEALLAGVAGQAATAIDNARLFQAVERELSERRRAESALRDSEERFRGITNSIDQMIWSTQPDGYHDYYNTRWYDYTGAPPGSTDGEGWNGMFHPDDQDRAWAVWTHCLETGEPYHIEYRLRHHSGQYRWVLGRAQPVRDDEGRIVRWFGTCTDIQEIVEARDVLARSREELEHAVEERTNKLMQAEEQLRQAQKMEAIGQLTGGIAHDFNNMLAVVIGGLNLLQRRLARGDTDVGKYVEGAMEGAKRAASLTDRLLAFSRQQPLAPEPIDANRLVQGMTELLSRTLGESILVETVLSAGLWKTHADINQLENAILNLSVNARDAMPDGGRLTIETANAHVDETYAAECGVTVGQYVLIAVTDTGLGMSPDVIAKAFDPFFTTKGVGKGTGLGLSQVFGFIRQSGGHVKIYSEVGIGTSVKAYLPRFYGEVEQAVRKPQAPAVGGETHEIVLVAEDEERVRAFSVDALKELGYSVIETKSGAEALAVLDSGQLVTLLFTDVVMPEMTGRQLADQALARRPGLKVLYTTGYTRNAVVHNGVLDPGTHFLLKPFGIDQLAAKVRGAIDS